MSINEDIAVRLQKIDEFNFADGKSPSEREGMRGRNNLS